MLDNDSMVFADDASIQRRYDNNINLEKTEMERWRDRKLSRGQLKLLLSLHLQI